MAEWMEWASAWVELGKVFTAVNGEALHPAAVTDRFHRIASAVELPPIRLHDLRHGAASLMLAAGVSMKVVQETLGHSSSSFTADIYTSVSPRGCGGCRSDRAERLPELPRTHSGLRRHCWSENQQVRWCVARDSNPDPAG